MVLSWLERHNLLRSTDPLSSPYLERITPRPVIEFSVSRRTPLKQNRFQDPLFTYYSKYVDPLPNFVAYDHSVQTLDSFQKALAKYFVPKDDYLWDDHWEIAESLLHRLFSPHVSGSRKGNLEFSIHSLDLSRSPGPQWKGLCDNKLDFVSKAPCLSYLARFYEDLFLPGGGYCLWATFLKDEIRDQARIDLHKTRIFICAPVEHFICMDVYCRDFNQKLIDAHSHPRLPSSVGIDLYHGGMDRLFRQLIRFPTKMCADVSGWDTIFKRIWFQVIIRLRYETLLNHTPRDLLALCNLYSTIIDTPTVLPDGCVITLPGQPSGQLNTAIDNTLGLTLAFLWVFSSLNPRVKFVEQLFIKCYGDDSVISHSLPVTPNQVAQKFQEIGIVIELSPYLEFLGHFFHFHEEFNIVVPMFPSHKIVAALVYNGSHNIESLCLKALSLRHMAFFDPDLFRYIDGYCQWIIETYPQFELRNQYLTETQIRKLYCGRVDTIPYRPQSLPMSGNPTNNNNNNSNGSRRRRNANRSRRRRNRRKDKREKSSSTSNNSSNSTLIGRMQSSTRRRPKDTFEPNGVLLDRSAMVPRNRGLPSGQCTASCCLSPYDAAVLKMMANPGSPTVDLVRVPMDGDVRTAVFRTRVSFDLIVNPTVNGGRFAFAVSPTLGNASNLKWWKICLADPAALTGINTEWSNTSNYYTDTTGSSYGLQDLRYDSQALLYTQPGLTYSTFTSVYTGGVRNFLGTATNTLPPDTAGNGVVPRMTNTGVSTVNLSFPPGMWIMSGLATGLASDFALTSNIVQGDGQLDVKFVVNSNQLLNGGTSRTYTFTYLITSTSLSSVFSLTDAASTAPATPTVWTFCSTSNLSQVSDQSGLIMAPGFDNGDVGEIRATAMSVLVTCLTPEAYTGGEITIAQVDPKTMATNWYAQAGNSQVGQLQYMNSLRNINERYDGPFKNGAYAYYKPKDAESMILKSPSQMMTADFNQIVVAGNFSPIDPTNANIICGRVLVDTVYEFTTSVPTIDTRICEGSSDNLDTILKIQGKQPSCMPNGKHLDYLKSFFSKVNRAVRSTYDFYQKNASVINGAATLALSLI